MTENNKPGFFEELKKRRVYRVAIVYAVTGWLLIQIADATFQFLNIPDWVARALIVTVIIGFPIAMILAWVFEMSPKGMIRTVSELAETNPLPVQRKKPFTGIVTIVFLSALVVAQFVYFNFIRKPDTELLALEIREERVAVAPFNNFTGDANLETLGFMASEWITSGFRQLKIKTSSPEMMRKYKDNIGILPGNPNNEVSLKELTDAQYVITGSYYKKGDSIQITSRLESTETGEILYEFPVMWGNLNQKEDLIAEVTEKFKGYWSVSESNKTTFLTPPKYEAYQTFLNTWMFDYYGLQQILELDSSFILARLYLAYICLPFEDELLYTNSMNYVKQNWNRCTEFEKNHYMFVESSRNVDFQAAVEWTEKNFQLDPLDYDIVHFSAYALLLQNRMKEAAKRYESIFQKGSNQSYRGINGNMRQAYMFILNRLGRSDEVLDPIAIEFDQNLKSREVARAHMLLGDTKYLRAHLGDVDEGDYLKYAWIYNAILPPDSMNIFEPLIRKNLLNYTDPKASRRYLMTTSTHMFNYESKALAHYILNEWEETERIITELQKKNIDWEALGEGSVPYPNNTMTSWRMTVWMNGLLGCTYARQGNVDKANAQIQLLELARASSPTVMTRFNKGIISYRQARIYAILGEKAKAVDLLERSRKEGRCMDFDNFIYDWDLAALKGYGPYEELIRPN